MTTFHAHSIYISTTCQLAANVQTIYNSIFITYLLYSVLLCTLFE